MFIIFKDQNKKTKNSKDPDEIFLTWRTKTTYRLGRNQFKMKTKDGVHYLFQSL